MKPIDERYQQLREQGADNKVKRELTIENSKLTIEITKLTIEITKLTMR